VLRGTDASARRYVFAYRRSKKGGENRLHDKWSVGVGGHINPCDVPKGPAYRADLAFPAVYEWGLRRELSEEMNLALGPDISRDAPAVALVYRPVDVVGAVHFGVVHIVDLAVDLDSVAPTDPALASGQWSGRQTLMGLADHGKFEDWSRLVVEHVRLL
jgi:predicted NUDIX family phosphoesterase